MSNGSSNYTNLTSTSGFVATVPISSSNGDILQGSSSLNFLIFMVIGFGATLGLIAVGTTIVIFVRRYLARRRRQAEEDEEMTATVPEPRKLYVVIHPGGTADVAHKEDDWDEPRQLVLKHKPIELNSAVIPMAEDTIPAHRTPTKQAPGFPLSRSLEPSAAPETVAIEIYPHSADAQCHLHLPPGVYKYHNPIYGVEEEEEPQQDAAEDGAESLDSPALSSESGATGTSSGSGWSEAECSASAEIRVTQNLEEQSEDANMLSQRYTRQ